MIKNLRSNALANNKGSAILTALFIMILVAIAATAMSLRLQIDINRTQLIQDISTLKTYAEQGRLIMSQALINNALNFSNKEKQNIDPLKMHLADNPQANLSRKITVIDLQSRFNLNNLIAKDQLSPFTLLIHNLIPKIDEETAFKIALQTKEWVSPEDKKIRNISSEHYYQSLKPSYEPAHQPFISVTELRLVKDLSQKIFNTLLPYISALPKKTPINLNTAPLAILKTLGAGLTDEQAKTIIEERGTKGFKQLEQALAHPNIKKLNLNAKALTLTSQYFLISSEVISRDSQIILFTTVKRTIDKKGVKLSIIQETINNI